MATNHSLCFRGTDPLSSSSQKQIKSFDVGELLILRRTVEDQSFMAVNKRHRSQEYSLGFQPKQTPL